MSMPILAQIVLGLVLSATVAGLAYRRHSLSGSGVAGAVVIGTVTFGLGGWSWGVLLVAFFALSSALSHLRAEHKSKIMGPRLAKSGRRDLGQTFANGGVGAMLAGAHFLAGPDPTVFAAFVGALATANADTWATELGLLSRRPPRSFVGWREVAPGTSGGVTPVGTLASAAGAAAMGLCAWLVLAVQGLSGAPVAGAPAQWFAIAIVGGVAGSLADSLLGATVQARYRAGDHLETEGPVGAEGERNELVRGWPWLGNDGVNFLSTIAGAGVAALLGARLD
jgi:uncharacterized protein (TIGR00297 family)